MCSVPLTYACYMCVSHECVQFSSTKLLACLCMHAILSQLLLIEDEILIYDLPASIMPMPRLR